MVVLRGLFWRLSEALDSSLCGYVKKCGDPLCINRKFDADVKVTTMSRIFEINENLSHARIVSALFFDKHESPLLLVLQSLLS